VLELCDLCLQRLPGAPLAGNIAIEQVLRGDSID
jgi:hypothetical protein